MDFFWDIVMPFWIIFGIFGLAGSIGYFCVAVSEYLDEKKRGRRGYGVNQKRLAQLANKVLKAAGIVIAVLILPVSIIPAALYFPFKGMHIVIRFFKQVLRDRKGETN